MKLIQAFFYDRNGVQKYVYEGENKRNALVEYMKNPTPPTPKPREPAWSETESDVVHLTATTFDQKLKEEESVLVMFYAPWCGHCKKMKPEYEAAAAKMKKENVNSHSCIQIFIHQ